MRIAVAGKGGAGKTTLAGTLARVLAADGRQVLAIDGDPAPNLALALGVAAEALPGLPALPAGGLRPGDTLATIRRAHATSVAPRLELLVAARAEEAGTGCLTAQHTSIRELLAEVPPGEVCVLDMDPTPEAFTRSVPRHADLLLVIARGTPASLLSARRITGLGRDLGVGRVELVANAVRSAADAEAVRALAAELGVPVAGLVPHDDALAAAEREGRAPIDAAPDGPAVRAITALARR